MKPMRIGFTVGYNNGSFANLVDISDAVTLRWQSEYHGWPNEVSKEDDVTGLGKEWT